VLLEHEEASGTGGQARGRSCPDIGGSQERQGMGRDKQGKSDSLGTNFRKNYNLGRVYLQICRVTGIPPRPHCRRDTGQN
jgi:hypothetical protein